jgi:hypothetical protein
MDDPFDLKEMNGFTLITAIVLLVMTRVLPFTEIWGSFGVLIKGPRKNSLHLISTKIGKCYCALYNLILIEPVNSHTTLVCLSL